MPNHTRYIYDSDKFNQAQRDGRACVFCASETNPMAPVAILEGVQLFACTDDEPAAPAAEAATDSASAQDSTGEGPAEQPTSEQPTELPLTPRTYALPIPSLAERGGAVRVRLIGPGDPIRLSIPAVLEFNKDTAWPDLLLLHISRDTAWGLWAVLSDALLNDAEDVPEWAAEMATPVDDAGQPVPDPAGDLPF